MSFTNIVTLFMCHIFLAKRKFDSGCFRERYMNVQRLYNVTPQTLENRLANYLFYFVLFLSLLVLVVWLVELALNMIYRLASSPMRKCGRET